MGVKTLAQPAPGGILRRRRTASHRTSPVCLGGSRVVRERLDVFGLSRTIQPRIRYVRQVVVNEVSLRESRKGSYGIPIQIYARVGKGSGGAISTRAPRLGRAQTDVHPGGRREWLQSAQRSGHRQLG